MRFRVLILVGVMVLAGLVLTSGGWTATFEEMKQEMSATPIPGRTSLDMRVPMVFSGTTGMLLTELCVSEGTIRPMDPSKRNLDMGKVQPGTQFSVPVQMKFMSDSGDHIFMYQGMVELPACK